MKNQNELIANFMGVIIMETNCCSCGKTLKLGDSIQYTTSGYDTYCDTTECADGIATSGTVLEDCWWLGDEEDIGYAPEDLNYHESWVWLKPVLIKIGMSYTDKTNRKVAYASVVDHIKDVNKQKLLKFKKEQGTRRN